MCTLFAVVRIFYYRSKVGKCRYIGRSELLDSGLDVGDPCFTIGSSINMDTLIGVFVIGPTIRNKKLFNVSVRTLAGAGQL